MHFLEISNELPFYILIGAMVSIGVLYLIIKGAVAAGTKKLHDQIFIQNRLILEQMKQEGVSEERLKEIVTKEIPA